MTLIFQLNIQLAVWRKKWVGGAVSNKTPAETERDRLER